MEEEIVKLEMTTFSPTIEELKANIAKFDNMSIADADDEEGFLAVKQARVECTNVKTSITKTGKAMRDGATAFNRQVLVRERELTDIVIPVEQKLKALEDWYKEEQEKKKRVKMLPERRDVLVSIGMEMTDDEILSMDAQEFSVFVNARRQEMLDAKEAELKAREDAIAEENRKKEADAELERIKKETEEKAVKDTEERMKREVEDAERKAKQEAEYKARLEKEEQEKMEQRTKYQEWLVKHEYNKETDTVTKTSENSWTLIRRVATFTLNSTKNA